MRKHATQLADLIDIQKDERERCLYEYRQKVAKKEKEKQAEKTNTVGDYNRLKTSSCESIANTATFLLRAGLRDDVDPESVAGCFGKVAASKIIRSPGSPTKRKQALLDPIRRWNSFHMRDKKTNISVIKSFEQFRRDYAKKKDPADDDQPSSPSMAVTGLMGALPRVIALRNEFLPADTNAIEMPVTQNKKQLSVDVEPLEKMRTLSQGDVGKTIPLNLVGSLREEITLTRQITKKLLLEAKRNSSKELYEDLKLKESSSSGHCESGQTDKDVFRSRTRSEGESDEKEKTIRESPKKLVRKKTKESLSVSKTEKPRRWSDRDETEKLEVEVEARNAISTRSSTSSDWDLDDDDLEW